MLALHPEHISCYQMSVEPGTVLARSLGNGCVMPSQEECAAQYALLQKLLAQAGYEQYEISNFCLPGYHSRHNSSYWNNVPYLGLGPAAHSFSGNLTTVSTIRSSETQAEKKPEACSTSETRAEKKSETCSASETQAEKRSEACSTSETQAEKKYEACSEEKSGASAIREWNVPVLQRYINHFLNISGSNEDKVGKPSPVKEREVLSEKDLFNEMLMLGLRQAKGVDCSELEKSPFFGQIKADVQQLLNDGLLVEVHTDACESCSKAGKPGREPNGNKAVKAVEAGEVVKNVEEAGETVKAVEAGKAKPRLRIPAEKFFVSDNIIRELFVL